MLDRAAFYDHLRKSTTRVFGTGLTQEQVDGMENLLDVWKDYYGDWIKEELAYDLATAYHETAHTMQPITERGSRPYFDKYEPGTRIGRVLGNTKRGDGYLFRGEGHVQNTGRRNAKVATQRLNERFNLRIDLEETPSLRGDPFVSAHSLFLGNHQGWWTGAPLTRYINKQKVDYVNARRVVNGLDRADTIAGYAKEFEAALEAGLYSPGEPKPPKVESKGKWDWVFDILRALLSLFKRSN